jgi:hypothetical protein
MVCRAVPKREVKASSVASWSGTASLTAHPLLAYEEPMSA